GQLSSDGNWLVYRSGDLDLEHRRSIFVHPMKGGPNVSVSTTTGFTFDPRFSPDGKWIAYTNTESGRPEIYVRPFPAMTAVVQGSVAGGAERSWSRDSRTLFYRKNQAMVAASVSTSGSFAVTSTTSGFTGNYLGDIGLRNYDVSADGKTFLMLQPVDRQA